MNEWPCQRGCYLHMQIVSADRPLYRRTNLFGAVAHPQYHGLCGSTLRTGRKNANAVQRRPTVITSKT